MVQAQTLVDEGPETASADGRWSRTDEQVPDLVPVNSVEFAAMGTACRIVLGGGAEGLVEGARAKVEDLERRWSRFRPDSEISQLNRHPDQLTIVSQPTFQLLSHAQTAREATGNRFNPLLLDQMEAIGYRQSWLECGADQNHLDANEDRCQPGSVEPIELMPAIRGVRLPTGSRFDPGGIGKGLAADLVTDWCVAHGATTVCVDLGGDIRVHGQPWYGPDWRIGVEHPDNAAGEVASFTPASGAVTTSTTLRRSWPGRSRPLHHLLDPATGQPVDSDLVSVTTCSSLAWWAEVAAKAALVSGSAGAADLLRQLDAPGIAITRDGRILTLAGRSAACGANSGRTAT
jgi:FAD:protein FMN transferase